MDSWQSPSSPTCCRLLWLLTNLYVHRWCKCGCIRANLNIALNPQQISAFIFGPISEHGELLAIQHSLTAFSSWPIIKPIIPLPQVSLGLFIKKYLFFAPFCKEKKEVIAIILLPPCSIYFCIVHIICEHLSYCCKLPRIAGNNVAYKFNKLWFVVQSARCSEWIWHFLSTYWVLPKDLK